MVNGWQYMGKLDGKAVYWHPEERWAIEKDASYLVAMSPEEVERFKGEAVDEGEEEALERIQGGLLRTLRKEVKGDLFESDSNSLQGVTG